MALHGALAILKREHVPARNRPVTPFGMVPLPNLVAAGSAIGRQAGDILATLAILLLVTVRLHVSGAL